MQNYWLSEYQSPDDEEMPEEEYAGEEPEDDQEDSDQPKYKLTSRQKMMYEYYEDIVSMHGMFDKTSLGEGAHYAPANKNPFIKDGLVCSNCVFFRGGQGCEIVAGKIEANAICKLWIIPNSLIKK